MKVILHLSLVVVLSALTQVGGLAWAIAMIFRQRLLAFLALYVALSLGAMVVAPAFGRVQLSCLSTGSLQVRSWVFCLTNRTYVTPELKAVAEGLAAEMAAKHPGTVTLALDGNFPFLDGFSLLPHLSHDDGEKLDLAFYYKENGEYLPGITRSPLGYFAFEQGPTACPDVWPTLRWDLGWLQPLFPSYQLDTARMKTAVDWLSADPRVGKMFLEPHLALDMQLHTPKLRFQGCRAARHDDHLHIQL